MRDAPAGTSLLQSRPEIDHRDQHHQHLHKHEHLHRRQPVDPLVTSITSTISVIQEVVVDQNGSTFLLKTILAASPTVDARTDPTVPPPIDATVSVPPAVLPVPPSPLIKPAPIPDVPTNSAGAAGPTTADAPLSVNTGPPLPVSSTPFLGSSNSSIPTSSGSSSPESTLTTLPNRTTLSSTRISKTGSTKIPSSTSTETTTSTSEEASSTSFVSFPNDSYLPSDSPTATVGLAPGATAGGVGGGLGGGAGGNAATGSTAATTPAATSDASGKSDVGQSTPTPVVVGGVVGAIAGIVFIIALVLVFVRWRKRKQSLLPLGSSDNPGAGPSTAEGSGVPPSQSREMTKRASPFAIPAALANLTGYKRTSHQPSMDHSSTTGSERGFYRVSGRKLPSVFQHGGDGYGGGHESLGGSSFYRDSQGLHGGPGSPTSPLTNRESGIPITRPSPARTPVISESAFAPPSPAPTSPAPSPMLPPRRPDALGRSHPSRDGSHVSKFTEQV